MQRERAICIVTPDIIGPIRNGGIGTHCYYLARHLARDPSNHVHVLFTARATDEPVAPWKDHYRQHGIEFSWLDEGAPAADASCAQGEAAALSARVDAWLRQRAFDYVHFQDWQANGFVPVQAKRTGQAHASTQLTVTMHSSTEWQNEGMESWPYDPRGYTLTSWCERYACRHADVVIAPTQHMLDWAASRGWELAGERRLVRYCYRPDRKLEPGAAQPADPAHLVFFGRLETRKGLGLFVRALLLALERRPGCVQRVSFVGKIADVEGQASDRYLREQLGGRAGLEFEIQDSLASFDALQFIARSRGVVVVPSLLDNSPFTVIECIENGLPFLAARTGGIPELCDPRALFDATPASMAERILALREVLQAPLRHPYENRAAERVWDELHREPAAARAPASPKSLESQGPRDVVACVDGRGSAQALRDTLESLRRQDDVELRVRVAGAPEVSPGASREASAGATTPAQASWRADFPEVAFVDAHASGGDAHPWGRAAQGTSESALWFLRAGQELEADAAANLLRAMRHSGADAVSGWWDVRGDERSAPSRVQPLGACLEYGFVEDLLGGELFLVRRAAFQELGGMPGNGAPGAGWQFLLTLALSGRVLEVAPCRVARGARREASGLSRSELYHLRRRALQAYAEHDPVLARTLGGLAWPMQQRLTHFEALSARLEKRLAFLPRFLFEGVPGKITSRVGRLAGSVLGERKRRRAEGS